MNSVSYELFKGLPLTLHCWHERRYMMLFSACQLVNDGKFCDFCDFFCGKQCLVSFSPCTYSIQSGLLSLTLSASYITDGLFQHVSLCASLLHLDVDGCAITDDGVAMLSTKGSAHLSIRGLSLSYTGITDHVAFFLTSQHFPELLDLWVAGCEQLTSRFPGQLPRNVQVSRQITRSLPLCDLCIGHFTRYPS